MSKTNIKKTGESTSSKPVQKKPDSFKELPKNIIEKTKEITKITDNAKKGSKKSINENNNDSNNDNKNKGITKKTSIIDKEKPTTKEKDKELPHKAKEISKEVEETSNKEDEEKVEKEEDEQEKPQDIDEIVKNIVLTEKDEQFLAAISDKLERLDAKIIDLRNNFDGESPEKSKISKKQEEINGNLEKLIQQVQEIDLSKPLDKNNDVKKSIENTIIEVFSRNQNLEELIEDMKKGFLLKNRQICNLQEELLKYTSICKEQEKQIEYLENRLSGKEKIINIYQEDPKKKLAKINEKLREIKIENSENNRNNLENPNNNDPYDIWKTNDDEVNSTKEKTGKSQKLEDILGNKNNLWILKHENELNQAGTKHFKK